jgi:SAM-dependent methyltransferase
MSSNYVCQNCGAKAMSAFYEAKDVPVHSCQILPTQHQALTFPRGSIVLTFCKKCGFISNVAFDSSKLDYSSIYEDQQCFSPTFNAFGHDLAKRLIEKYDLHNKSILEIGCGKGDFLALLCELGHNSGVGIDPAYVEGRIDSEASHRLEFIRDCYSERYANYHGDLVCCRHTLEHIHDTKAFVETVRAAIGNRLNTIVFFEVPDIIRVLRELAFWDIYYEHCSYFSPGSLARLFRSCKFEVTDLSKDFDDQYLLIEAKPVNHVSEKAHELEENVEDLAELVSYFSTHCHDKLDQWKDRLQQIQADGRRAVIWGSGSKCVAFVTTLGLKDEVEYVIDINPYRHGKFIPGGGHKIMPPQFLRQYKPDVVIVMNPIYRVEIQQTLDNMKVDAEAVSV